MVSNKVDLCVAGEESYLVKDEGLANACARVGIPCWGPVKESATRPEAPKFQSNRNTRAEGGRKDPDSSRDMPAQDGVERENGAVSYTHL